MPYILYVCWHTFIYSCSVTALSRSGLWWIWDLTEKLDDSLCRMHHAELIQNETQYNTSQICNIFTHSFIKLFMYLGNLAMPISRFFWPVRNQGTWRKPTMGAGRWQHLPYILYTFCQNSIGVTYEDFFKLKTSLSIASVVTYEHIWDY